MLYKLYDLQHALLTPARIGAELTKTLFNNPLNPISYTNFGRTIAASSEMFERVTRRFGKPSFGLTETTIGENQVRISEEILLEKPFCNLLHFKRATKRKDPKVLIVAPMSGHFATLLRGTVEALLPHHDVYITDWIDARMVPLKDGRFNLDDFIDYVRQFLTFLGPDTHVIAVCQPAPPVFAAISLMASENDANQPLTMTLMGGPIDTRISKTAVTRTAETRPLTWFKNNVTDDVPVYYPGAQRKVYPGFLQLSGFMSMNLERHVGSHMQFYKHVVQGDGESAEAHRKFYDEYNAVMDLSAEFYLQTVDVVFQRQLLPKGEMKWRDPATDTLHDVRPSDIRHTAILTVEGELDDISARGQTAAAHDLADNLAPEKHFHHYQPGCGHYGIFNGRKWRNDIMPRVRHFIRQFDTGCSPIPKSDLVAIPDHAPEHFDPKNHGVEAVRQWLREQEALAAKEGRSSKFFEGSDS